jgi:hypothetical protein
MTWRRPMSSTSTVSSCGPFDRDRVPPGRHLVTGWAWSSSPITRVELSTDGGTSWHASHVVAQGPAPAWQRFGFEWDAAAPGAYDIRARATDSRGRVQPTTGRNAVHAITVMVVGDAAAASTAAE